MEEATIKDRVRKLMHDNLKEGYSPLLKEHYSYVRPSPGKYPFQWFWDTFFHIYILCALDECEAAKNNLRSIFAMQEPDGFVGHMIYWKRLLPPSLWEVLESRPTLHQFRPHMSALIQPTFAAQSLERIYEVTNDVGFVKEMLPKIKHYHQWVLANRSYEENRLIFIIAPMESGMDEKPSYDPLIGSSPSRGTFRQWMQLMWIEAKNFYHRYNLPKIYTTSGFIVKDAAMNTIYTLDLLALSRLCAQHDDVIEALYYENIARQVSKSILELMYNEEDAAFYDVGGKQHTQLRTLTSSIFFPIALPDVPDHIARKVIKTHLLNADEFDLPYPIPSVAKSEKTFQPRDAESRFFDFLWRGPTWVMCNWFLYKCLLTKGFEKEADKVLNSVIRLIETSGFREYYNPLSGVGYGAKDFTWSGLVVDMLRIRDGKR